MKESKPLAELLDSVRDIEGFPIGKDEDILALSNPPYYTACPNPYINDFIEEYGKPYNEATDDYHRDPFVGDVSEGKNDPIYNAHSYHTKVPHKAIMKYIEHYTDEGDIVFDGFCGTGMTGVAAQMLNRKAILSDLSPIATFIAHNYNSRVDVADFENEARRILYEVEQECGWMYETMHTDGKTKGRINYTVWSDIFICPFCGNEIIFYEAAVDKEEGSVKKEFPCPSCRASVKKTDCRRAVLELVDDAIGETITQAKQIPVLINYSMDKQRAEKEPDEEDLALIEKINRISIPYWFPTDRIQKGDKTGEPLRIGITHVHHFYTKRNLWVLAAIKSRCRLPLSHLWFNSQLVNISKLNRYRPNVSFPYNPLSGTLYIASQISESNVFTAYFNKQKRFVKALYANTKNSNIIATNSITTNILSDDSIDYIFTDPPFGDNLMYSELNFIWESWLKVKTNNKPEAIVNKSQNKDLSAYHNLMYKAFQEYYRVLKPNRWITVEFHNSKSSVWNAIQAGLTKAGFLVANVAILNKQQGSFNQVTATGAVKNDLVISAYKPKGSFRKKFLESAGEGMEEEFIRMHLSHLPEDPSIERTEQMLYSKLLAFYVQRSYTVKYDATSFYAMLRQQFIEEDGYWFTTEQLRPYQEYKQKMKLEGIKDIAIGQHALFVADEKSALIWLNTFLSEPKDFQAIHPAFTKVVTLGNDKMPELKDILHENFVYKGDKYRRPRSEDEKLSINEKRGKALLHEFDELLIEAKASKKKIKECRKQAVLYGFEYCYKRERFKDILELARKLDRKILENDSELNEFVEVAEIKVEGF